MVAGRRNWLANFLLQMRSAIVVALSGGALLSEPFLCLHFALPVVLLGDSHYSFLLLVHLVSLCPVGRAVWDCSWAFLARFGSFFLLLPSSVGEGSLACCYYRRRLLPSVVWSRRLDLTPWLTFPNAST